MWQKIIAFLKILDEKLLDFLYPQDIPDPFDDDDNDEDAE